MTHEKGEREFEVGKDEAWFANIKRTYDEYQGMSLQHARNLDNIALQAIQNAVTVANKLAMNSAETDNMIAKQAVAHRDIAIDCEWVPGPGEENIKP